MQKLTQKSSLADIFESYVGGLYVDQGLDAVKSWLIPLFRPYSTLAYSIVRTQHGLPPLPTPESTPLLISVRPPWATSPLPIAYNTAYTPMSSTIGHLALFNQHVQKGNRAVEWVYSDGAEDGGTKTTPVWVVKVLVDGKCLGRGKGGTKKGARNEAAKEGLVGLGIYV